MANTNPRPRPGDYLLNRYFPDADPETRERARETFREFARVLEELGEEEMERLRANGSIPVDHAQPPHTLSLPL